MKQLHLVLQAIAAVGCFLGVLVPFAWAGDCTSPDDCTAPRDNAVKAAGGAAIATGIGLALRGLNGDDEEEPPDEGEGSGEASDLEKIFGVPIPDPKSAPGNQPLGEDVEPHA